MKQKVLTKNGFQMHSLLAFMGLLLVMQQSVAQTLTSNSTGTNNGYYYSFWKQDATGTVSMTLVGKGHYTATWSGVSNFTCGEGWSTGSPSRVINYKGTFNGGNNGYLALYGWTKNALIEYYVVENHGSYTPPGGTSLGTVNTDGGTYNIYKTQRVNAPSISSNSDTFYQYWSVRTTTRSSGTITFANHVAAWASHNMVMGSTWDYQIIETEGYQSSGSSDVTFSEGTITDVMSGTAQDGNGFDVYPNPVTDKLTFMLPVSSADVTLFSGNGAEVLTLTTDSPEVKIDMSKYEAGIYFLKIVTDGQTITKKVMKQ